MIQGQQVAPQVAVVVAVTKTCMAAAVMVVVIMMIPHTRINSLLHLNL